MTRITILPQGSTLIGTVTYADTGAQVSLFSNTAQTAALAQPASCAGPTDIWFTPTKDGRAVVLAFTNNAGTSAINVTRPFSSAEAIPFTPSTTTGGLFVPNSIAPVGVQTPNLIRQAFGDVPIDQTAVIQAAMDAAWTSGGGQVWLPAGVVYGSLKMRPDVDLVGKGWQTVLRAMPGQAAHVLDYSAHNAYHAVARDLRVDGNAGNGATGRCIHMDTNPTTGTNFIFNNAGIGPMDPAINDNGMAYAQVPRWNDSANSIERVLCTNSAADWAVFLGLNNRGDWLRELFVFQCINGGLQNAATDTQAVDVQVGACGDGILIAGPSQGWANCKSWYHGVAGVQTGTGDGWRITEGGTTGFGPTKLTGCESQDNNRHGLNIDKAGSVKAVGFVSGGDTGAGLRLGNAQSCDIDMHIASADRAQNILGVLLDGAAGSPTNNRVRWTMDAVQFATGFTAYSTVGGALTYNNDLQGPNAQLGQQLITAPQAAITPSTAKTLLSGAWAGNLTVNAYNGAPQTPGEKVTIQLFDTGAGARTVTWDASWRGAPAVVTQTGKLSSAEFVYIGSGIYGAVGSSVNV